MQGMMENMPAGGMWGTGMMFFMTLLWIAVFVLIVMAVVYLVRYLQRSGRQETPAHETPLDILKKRYARGEIDKKEFEEKKRELM